MPPELQSQLDEQTEQIIDDWIEQKHAHEIVVNPPETDEPDF